MILIKFWINYLIIVTFFYVKENSNYNAWYLVIINVARYNVWFFSLVTDVNWWQITEAGSGASCEPARVSTTTLPIIYREATMRCDLRGGVAALHCDLDPFQSG